MIRQVLFAIALTGVTVIIHGFGTLESVAQLSRVWQRTKGKQGSLASVIYILRVMVVLLLLHWGEAAIWAAFYLISGAMPNLETATYFSLTSYTTLGYGDVVLPVSWRLLGPFEGAVGILMFGWSTGIMVAAINKIYGNRMSLRSD
jgi:voltage-gated potassium channel